LEALKTSRFVGNREFAQRVGEILALARSSHRDHHAGKLNREALALYRPALECQRVLDNPLVGGWPADAQRLADRLKRHEWFTFLSYPEVKPDNNDAERVCVP